MAEPAGPPGGPATRTAPAAAAARARAAPAPPRRLPLTLWIGGTLVALHVVLALVGPLLAPHDFDRLGAGPAIAPASWAHPFGTDGLGRDVFSRVLHGAPIVLLLSLSGTALGLVVGAALGLISAYVGGWLDEVIQRLLEALIAIPFIMLALLAIAAAGPDLAGEPALVAIAVAIVYIPRVGRMARAAALDLVARDFVTAARLRGEGAWSVVRRELLPNAAGVLLVEFALRAGYAPVLVGALGFLGFGIQPPTPEWGAMIAENRDLILRAPVTVLGPAAALATLVVGLNLATDGLARMIGRQTGRGV